MRTMSSKAVSLDPWKAIETNETGPALLVRPSHPTDGSLARKVRIMEMSQCSSKLPVVDSSAADGAIFRQEGDFWTLCYAGKTIRLKNVKGLVFISHLLKDPGTELHAQELARVAVSAGQLGHCETATPNSGEVAGDHIGYLGNAGEMLDDRAKAAYRRRLSELREEQQEARTLGQVNRAQRAEGEIDALVAELARATGLNGRSRVAGSSAERARQSVTRAIKCALGRICEHHPALGQMLARQIRTGTYCRYQPDPDERVCWELEAAGTNSAPSDSQRSLVKVVHDESQPAENPARRELFTSRTELFCDHEVQFVRDIVDQGITGRTAVAVIFVRHHVRPNGIERGRMNSVPKYGRR